MIYGGRVPIQFELASRDMTGDDEGAELEPFYVRFIIYIFFLSFFLLLLLLLFHLATTVLYTLLFRDEARHFLLGCKLNYCVCALQLVGSRIYSYLSPIPPYPLPSSIPSLYAYSCSRHEEVT